jgi:hypothetical protein
VDRHLQFNMDAAQARHIELVMSPLQPGIVPWSARICRGARVQLRTDLPLPVRGVSSGALQIRRGLSWPGV